MWLRPVRLTPYIPLHQNRTAGNRHGMPAVKSQYGKNSKSELQICEYQAKNKCNGQTGDNLSLMNGPR